MASLGSALINKVLGHTEAEKAFRPWWDTLEDLLIYGLVMLGLVVVPTAIINATPLDCNFCQEDLCSPYNNTGQDPRFNYLFVKKQCTFNGSLDPVMLYFPYVLLTIALVMVLIEKVFVAVFKADVKLDKFYKLLVNQNILEESDEEEASDSESDAIEVRQSFCNNESNYYTSYMVRTLLELSVAVVWILWLLMSAIPVIKNQHHTLHCSVHGFWYECSGHPQQFYLSILYIASCLLGLYIVTNIYNLVWLTLPNFSKLSQVMTNHKINGLKKLEQEDLNQIYYLNRDIRLLLDLLAATSGVAPALTLISILDKPFLKATEAKILTTKTLDGEVTIELENSPIEGALTAIPGLCVAYVVEIYPSVLEDGKKAKALVQAVEAGGNAKTRVVTFTGTNDNSGYTARVKTTVNGRTISKIKKNVNKEGSFNNELLLTEKKSQ